MRGPSRTTAISRGEWSPTTLRTPSRFTSSLRTQNSSQRLTLLDAVAVPVETPLRDIGLRPLPTTGPYEWVDVSRDGGTIVRNPYFREWSHAARPDGYPDRIVWRHIQSDEAGLTAVERGRADYDCTTAYLKTGCGEVQTRFAGQLYSTPTSSTLALFLNTRTAPFTDVRVRRAINYAIDRAKIAQLLGRVLTARLPDTAGRPPRLPTLLPLHDPSQPRRNMASTQPREGRASHRGLPDDARHANHDLEPRCRLQRDARPVPRLGPRPARVPDTSP